MPRKRFFDRPQYCEYIRLLVRLHDMIAARTDEGISGDSLRAEMDACGEVLDDDEVVSLQGISADLYSLSEKNHAPIRRTEEAQQAILAAIEAQRSGDYVAALDLLRCNRSLMDQSHLSYFRGRALSDAGLNDVAFRFFDLASRLAPENDDYRYVCLDSLKRFDFASAEAQADAILSTSPEPSSKLRLKAAEIRFESIPRMPREDGVAVARQLIPTLQRVIVDFESNNGRHEGPDLLPFAYALCGFCFQDRGDVENARRCFEQALRLDPYNDAMLTARGILLYGRDSTAVNSFLDAVGLESAVVWPYLFLAHHFLLHDRYEACLAMCERSLLLPSSDSVRANCYEWIAICQAALGRDPTTVRVSFHKAVQLAPGNSRIERNRRVFEDSITNSGQSPIPWEKNTEGDVRKIGEEFRLAA